MQLGFIWQKVKQNVNTPVSIRKVGQEVPDDFLERPAVCTNKRFREATSPQTRGATETADN